MRMSVLASCSAYRRAADIAAPARAAMSPTSVPSASVTATSRVDLRRIRACRKAYERR